MAIYQFYLALVPEVGLLQKHTVIPEQIATSTKDGYFEANTEAYWAMAEMEASGMIQDMDALLNRSSWGNTEHSFTWKTCTNLCDNDAYIEFNQHTGFVKECLFRADLTEYGLYFLKAMLRYARRYNCVLMDRNGYIAKPETELVWAMIKRADKDRFLKDPEAFLKGIVSKATKPKND